MRELEHPDITSALETGYPTSSRRRSVIAIPDCTCCGLPISEAEWYFDWQGEIVCNNCIEANKHDVEDSYYEI